MGKSNSIDEYIAQYSPEQQERLLKVRKLIRSACPEAEEKISWGMPTFVYFGNLVHFAQQKNHIGFYPGDSGVRAFEERLAEYVHTKGSIHIQSDQPIPEELILEIVAYRMDENRTSAERKRQKPVRETAAMWDLNTVMRELEALGTEQTRKTYMRHGAHEPLFGVTTGAMKPMSKRIKKNYELSMELYDTGNYDAMYFAGVIADVERMTKSDFEKWIEAAYCHGLSDYVVAVSLAETPFAQEVADRWIASERELYRSAGWSCYSWLLGFRPDSEFDVQKLKRMLNCVEETIHDQQNWVRYAMNGFVIAMGISYLPLHKEAVHSAEVIGEVSVNQGNTSCKTPLAHAYIEKATEKGRVGFKRRSVRC